MRWLLLAPLSLLAGACSFVPSFGTHHGSSLPVPRVRHVEIGSRGYVVASQLDAATGSAITAPLVGQGQAAVVSYGGSAGNGTVSSLHVAVLSRLVFVRAGRVVATATLSACSVSCRSVTPRPTFDTLVVVGGPVPLPARRQAVTFS
jgi:hypothetical protein